MKRAGARITPEAAVFVPGSGGPRLVYHGRIDDRYPELGRMRPAPTTRDLEDVLEAVLAGRPVPRDAAPAVGCFLADVGVERPTSAFELVLEIVRKVTRLKDVVGCVHEVTAPLALILAATAHANGSADGSAVTFTKDIAPIVYANCAACHRPGGVGPFSLLTYDDARKRARQMAAVTGARYMPPWPPESGKGEFVGERRITDAQIARIRQWVEAGAPEGRRADLPPPPRFPEGWALGEPDLVLTLPEPWTLPPGGTDVFRNFVLPVPVTRTRYVRALEIRLEDRKIAHHANVLVDRTRSARRRDAQDGEPGFAGMELAMESEGFDPDSHFLFWKPGSAPYEEPPDMAWRLDLGADLVLNLHLKPSGKPERMQPKVGLYFTEQAPVRLPMLLQLEHDGALDIPPGAAGFVVTDEIELPVAVEVLGIYPHAHYVGKDVQGVAILPDGRRRWATARSRRRPRGRSADPPPGSAHARTAAEVSG